VKQKRNLKSFTLLELVIVIIIIGILAAAINISIPNNTLQTETDKMKNYFRIAHSYGLKYDGWSETNQSWKSVCFEINESNNSVSAYINENPKKYIINPLNKKDLNNTQFKSNISADFNIICFSPFGDIFENNISKNNLITHDKEINLSYGGKIKTLIITPTGFIYESNN